MNSCKTCTIELFLSELFRSLTEETMLTCVDGLSCEDYNLFYTEEDAEPCLGEYRAYETACEPFLLEDEGE